MTDPKRPRDLETLLGDAYAERGELPPATVDEVERAEASGVEDEAELPASLGEYRPPVEPVRSVREPNVISLDARRSRARTLATHAVAVVVGFAAAAALFVSRERTEPIGGGTSASGEPAIAKPDAAPPSSRVAIGPVRTCEAPCCAGSRCSAARPDLRACSSGRECIGCSFEQLSRDRHRLKLSSFAPADPARKLLERGRGAALDLCVQLGSSEVKCVPAHANTDGSEQWTALPLVASAQDLLAGFLLQVRLRGSDRALAEWRGPVRLNPTVLCKGLLLKPENDKDEVFGTVSVFLEDTYWVEIERSDDAIGLEERARRYELADAKLSVVETSASGRDRLALRAGPLSKAAAEKLSRELLRHKQEARVLIGEDHLRVLTTLP